MLNTSKTTFSLPLRRVYLDLRYISLNKQKRVLISISVPFEKLFEVFFGSFLVGALSKPLMYLIANWHLGFKSLDVKVLNIHVNVILLCYFIIGLRVRC